MSNTPRTDQQSFDTYLKDGRMMADRVVAAEFARNLERKIQELKEVLLEVEKYLVDRGIEYRGEVGRTIILPKIRSALNK